MLGHYLNAKGASLVVMVLFSGPCWISREALSQDPRGTLAPPHHGTPPSVAYTPCTHYIHHTHTMHINANTIHITHHACRTHQHADIKPFTRLSRSQRNDAFWVRLASDPQLLRLAEVDQKGATGEAQRSHSAVTGEPQGSHRAQRTLTHIKLDATLCCCMGSPGAF